MVSLCAQIIGVHHEHYASNLEAVCSFFPVLLNQAVPRCLAQSFKDFSPLAKDYCGYRSSHGLRYAPPAQLPQLCR